MTLHKPCLAVPSLREAEAAGNTSDVDVDQQQLGKLVGGDSVPDIPLPDVPLCEARLDSSVGRE